MLIFTVVLLAIAGLAFAGFKAVYAYKIYTAEARLKTLMPIMDDLIKESILFAKANREFPNAYQLGLSSKPNSIFVDDPTKISKYLGGKPLTNGNSLNMSDVSGSNPCRAEGKLWTNIDVSLLGFPSDFANNSGDYTTNSGGNGIECHYWYYNDEFYSQCFYALGTAEHSQTGDLIPGWINANETQYWDFHNMDEYNIHGHNDATCPP